MEKRATKSKVPTDGTRGLSKQVTHISASDSYNGYLGCQNLLKSTRFLASPPTWVCATVQDSTLLYPWLSYRACRAPVCSSGTRSEEDRSLTPLQVRSCLTDADKQKPAASNSTAPAPNSGTSPTGGSTAAPPPQPEIVESPEVFGSRVPPPPGGGSTWDPTKQPRRPSIAVFKPDAVDDALQGFRYSVLCYGKAFRTLKFFCAANLLRSHFDVTPGELGMNPPSIAWFVCLTFTMFSLTLAVLFIAYYVNRPGSYIPPVANITKKPIPGTYKM
ncbi:hypothetical protein HPB51_005299 [Rhipicephalus microplus]|uniref:Uncharacterized protein n=1 Tax=Rhipicephalus microplus TaxID=6941 RepID=A0A9J6EX38_RHIMP|nr:hypothetical protein HPB51_005299 [Rhipicephalus microplus]